MSNDFWKGETYAIVKAMRRAGNQPGLIAQWKENVAQWAQMYRTEKDAQAVNAWLPYWQPRPFYDASELAPMWPALAIAIGHTIYWPPVLKTPRRLEFELDYAGLPRLAAYPQLFVVERIHYWSNATPEEVEREVDAYR